MAKFCPYCGSQVKTTDKFCIICGKPLLTDIPKGDRKIKSQPIKEEEEIQPIEAAAEEQEGMEIKEEPFESKTKEILSKKSKKQKEKLGITPLPEDVKEQMVYYIEYNDIQLNKKVLIEKLKGISKSTKDPRYGYDSEFKKEVNIKVEAIKTLISEMKEKEAEIKQNLEEPFIVQKIKKDIDTKVFQLENLSREHKLKKVDKETFEKLRTKYKEEKFELETERKELLTGMKLWIQELKLEKVEISGERKLNKGQFHSKEITEEEYTNNDRDFDLRLKKIETKIKTLAQLTK
ncbi:MAG: zinc ribbon domain-containing protein [Promethearchaeota archaeon]|jgi:hypothetical protein